MKILISMTVTFLLLGCTPEKVFKPTEIECEELEDSILPLCLENTWDYQYSRFDTNDSLFLTALTLDTITMEVNYTVSLWTNENSFTGFGISSLIIDPYRFETSYLKNNPDGLYYAIREGTIIETESIEISRAIPYPTEPGDSTIFIDYLVLTVSDSVQVTVPSGTFTCIQYDGVKNGSLIGQMWCAPNVGIIKSWQFGGFSEKLVHELIGYELH